MIKFSFKSTRRAALCLGVALSLAAAVPARADNPPKLNDAAGTAYLQKVSDVADDLLKAVTAKDEAKTKELNAKFDTVMKDGDAVMGKLPPADQSTAGTWMMDQMKKLADAGWAPGT